MTKSTLAIAFTASLTILAAWWLERRAQAELRAQNQALQRQVEQWAQARAARQPLSSGGLKSEAISPSPEDQSRDLLRLRGEVGLLRRELEERDRLQEDNRKLRSNLLARVLAGQAWELSPEQLASYFEKKGRSAETLLAAFEVTHDNALLQEALKKYPNDPRVDLLAAVSHALRGERRQWLDALKQSAPQNALADYLSASDHFQSGDSARALQELAAAAAKSKLEDYSRDFFQSLTEVYSAASYPDAAAKVAAWSRLDTPPLNELDQLRRSLGELITRYRQAGDEESAQALLQMGLRLGQRLADESLGIKTENQEAVGILVQRRLLETMDPASAYDGTGQTVKDRLEELALRRTDIVKLRDPSGWGGYLLRKLSEPDLITYFERLSNSSEVEARRWAVTRQSGD
jgi:hypothetical protein